MLRLEQKMDTMASDIKEFKAEIAKRDKQIEDFRSEISDLTKRLEENEARVVWQEQRSRNYCLRIQGVNIDSEIEDEVGHTKAAADAVYSKVIVPLLKKSMAEKDIPPLNDMIETAHKLASVGPVDAKTGKRVPPAIIVRFKSREQRNSVIRVRKELKNVGVDRNEKKMGVANYWITEDLTREIQHKLQECINSQKVKKAWSIDGRIRVILQSNEKKVIKCKSHIFDIDFL